MFERKEWLERINSQPPGLGRRASTDASLIERAQQAAVAAEALMADQHWALYQQLIAGSIDRITKLRDGLIAKLASPAVVNMDEMWGLKGQIAELTGMRAALELALSLPRALADDGAKAAETLAAQLAAQGEPDGSRTET